MELGEDWVLGQMIKEVKKLEGRNGNFVEQPAWARPQLGYKLKRDLDVTYAGIRKFRVDMAGNSTFLVRS